MCCLLNIGFVDLENILDLVGNWIWASACHPSCPPLGRTTDATRCLADFDADASLVQWYHVSYSLNLQAQEKIQRLIRNMYSQIQMQKYGFTMEYYKQMTRMQTILITQDINWKNFIKKNGDHIQLENSTMHTNLLKVLETECKKHYG